MTITEIYKIFRSSNGVCTDTRQIRDGVIFFALKGTNFNGNAFAGDALSKGAAYAVIDEEQYKKDDRYILVNDALTALQQLANHHRKQFDIPFLAITGSNGKTTTKELIARVLATRYRTYATVGNLNNHIGIPLTLLSIREDVEMAVIEMGANHQKEIEGYCKVAEPTHGIITNIGKAHLEGFGGIEGVKRGKGELYDYLQASGGEVFMNAADPVLASMSKSRSIDAITYPLPDSHYRCDLLATDPYLKLKAENGEVVDTQIIGVYNFSNIAAALCIGKYFNVPEKDANEAIATYVPENNRSQVLKKGSNTIILDAYNANPSSMKAAVENFDLVAAENKMVILGDMFELGDESADEHKKLADLIATKKIGQVIFCGKHMVHASNALGASLHFENRAALEEHLRMNKPKNAYILVKGSRGMGLEHLVDLL